MTTTTQASLMPGVTTRCSAVERKAFSAPTWYKRHSSEQFGEPALGTLEQRLAIITYRLGGPYGAIRASTAERREHARWLASNGLTS